MKVLKLAGMVLFEKEEEAEAMKHFQEALRKLDKDLEYRLGKEECVANITTSYLYDIFYIPLEEELSTNNYKSLEEKIEEEKSKDRVIRVNIGCPLGWLDDNYLDYILSYSDEISLYPKVEGYDHFIINIYKNKKREGYEVSEYKENYDKEEHNVKELSKEELKKYLLSLGKDVPLISTKLYPSKDIESVPAFVRQLKISNIIRENLLDYEEGNGYISDPEKLIITNEEKMLKLYGIENREVYKGDDSIFIQINSFSGYCAIFKLKATDDVLNNIEDIALEIGGNLRVVRTKEIKRGIGIRR